MVNIDASQVKAVYKVLQDDISRRIFTDRFLYSLTDDESYIHDIIELNAVSRNFKLQIEKSAKNSEIVLWGYGGIGKAFYNCWAKKLGIHHVVDRSPNDTCPLEWLMKPRNLPEIHSPDWLNDRLDVTVIITLGANGPAVTFENEIRKYLLGIGFSENQIVSYRKLNEAFVSQMYFDLPEQRFVDGQTFIDCGSYDGFNSVNFSKIHRNKCNGTSQIIAVDPDFDPILLQEGGYQYQFIRGYAGSPGGGVAVTFLLTRSFPMPVTVQSFL